MSVRSLFVTGTDTGVGKTLVGRLLCAAWRESGHRVHVLKPSETGCPTEHGEQIPTDAVALAAAAGDTRSLDEICPFRFSDPVAPAVAAQRAGQPAPSLEHIRAAYEAALIGADRVVMEGAGGLLVPFADEFMAVDIPRELGVPTLVVARLGLGTINHTLLTVSALRERGVGVAGVVLSATEPGETLATQTNAEVVRRHLAGTTDVMVLPWLGEAPQADPKLAHQHLAALLRG